LALAGWFNTNSGGRTHAVGELKSNPFGLYDNHGNVWEWVQDGWKPTYYREFQEMPAFDPIGPSPTGSQRVFRSGTCDFHASLCRASNRLADDPKYRSNRLGFRVALTVGAAQAAIAERKIKPASTTARWHGWPPDAPPPAIAPFDAGQAKQHQEDWARYLGETVDYENSLGMKFTLIPPGQFVMGRSPRDADVFRNEKLAADDLPAHDVTLTQSFSIGVTEVTQRQWKELMGTTPWLGKKQAVDDENRPATYVSWFDAGEFCRKLSVREGEAYRLPTEAEWEFACRAGTTTAFSFGDNVSDLSTYAWIRRDSQDLPQTVAVKKPNPWGLFDMHGNAWEWCNAEFSPYSSQAVVDPQTSGEGKFRVLRGGCFWSVFANDYRSAVRRRWPANLGYPESGFRVVRTARKGRPAGD
jgi:formylglycine-generating enzyme required for sulfatase activity